MPDILCGVKGYQMCLYKRLGWFSSYESVGTELALFGLRKQSTVSLVKLDIYQRQGVPRFGNSFRANRKIISSLYRAVRKDMVNTNKIAN